MSNVRSLPGTHGGATDSDPEADRHVHIVLLGLMGSGKSTVGRLVANELGRPFVDSDSIVELRTGHRPPEVVRRSGVEALHDAELAAMRQVVAKPDSVIFAAAASLVDHVDADELRSTWCVWLETSPEVLAKRIREDGHERPLVGDEPESVMTAQHEDRAARGRELAAVSVVTDGRSPTEVAACVCNAWRDWARLP